VEPSIVLFNRRERPDLPRKQGSLLFSMYGMPIENYPVKREFMRTQMRHYEGWNSKCTPPSKDIPVPANVVPAADYGQERAHFEVWNTSTLNRPLGPSRRILKTAAPEYIRNPTEKVQGKKYIAGKDDVNWVKVPQRRHYSKKKCETDYVFDWDRLNKGAKAPGKPGHQFSLEDEMQRKVQWYTQEDKRNGIQEAAAGDKTYKQVQMSDNFYKYGSTVAGEEFDKQSGEAAGCSIPIVGLPRGRKLDPERSDKSDRFGRDQLLKQRGGVSSGEEIARDKSIPYSELQKRAAKASEIRSVEILPDEVLWGDKADAMHDDAAESSK